jgi:hypothetical protein
VRSHVDVLGSLTAHHILYRHLQVDTVVLGPVGDMAAEGANEDSV